MKFSVVLPTFNGKSKGFINESINSVLNQSLKPLELIVVNDGSSDSTKRYLETFKTNPIVKIINQQNSGLPAARNAGIKLSSGDYLCFIDDDDIWESDKLEQTQLEILNNMETFLHTNLTLINESGETIGEQCLNHDTVNLDVLKLKNVINSPSSVCLSRSLIEKVGLFDESLKSSEDYDYWLRAAEYARPHLIKKKLVRYRVHSENMSKNLSKMEIFNLFVLYKHSSFQHPTSLQLQTFYLKFYNKYRRKKDYINATRCFIMYITHTILIHFERRHYYDNHTKL